MNKQWHEQIPILDIVEACGLQTKKKGTNEYGIYDDGEMTSGWGIAIDKNYVNDFTKNRGKGGPFAFVKSYNNISDYDTYLRLEDKFPNYMPEKKDNIMDIWKKLKPLSPVSVQYLEKRGIIADRIKHYTREYDGIACIVSLGDIPNGINARTLSTDHKFRFKAYKGYSTTGIYRGNIDNKKDYIIVVEGLIDFLTIAQHDSNVVGLKSAQDGWGEIRRLSKTYDVYVVFDNDDAGKESKKNLEGVKYYDFQRISAPDCKDFNDAYNMYELGDSCVDVIKMNSNLITNKITSLETKRTYTRGIDGVDKKFGKIADRDLVIVTAGTNQGKTTFINFLANKNGLQGKGVVYFTIELSKTDIINRYAFTKERLTKDQFNEGNYTDIQKQSMLKIIYDYEKNFDLVDFQKVPTIDELCTMIIDLYTNKQKTLFVIDNLGNIETPGVINELEQQRQITTKLQQLKNNNDLCIILVHHNNKYKKKESISDHSISNIRGNQKIADNANIIAEVSRHFDELTGENVLKISQHKDTQGGVSAHCILQYDAGNFIYTEQQDD